MNTTTSTKKASHENKSSKDLKIPSKTDSNDTVRASPDPSDTPFRRDGSTKYNEKDLELKNHDQTYSKNPSTTSILPPEASNPSQTVASKAPEYMENWREFCNGQVTDAHIDLVKTHAFKVGIENELFDKIIARDAQNIQLLAQLK